MLYNIKKIHSKTLKIKKNLKAHLINIKKKKERKYTVFIVSID